MVIGFFDRPLRPLRRVINWQPGKTAIVPKFRGTGSVGEYERLRPDHVFGVPIQGTDLRANVVHSCKYLGEVLQSNLSNMMFVDKHASCAMTNHVPIAGRVFSVPYIDDVQASLCKSARRPCCTWHMPDV